MSTFEKSELGRIKKLLPLREMAENFGTTSKSMRTKRGRLIRYLHSECGATARKNR